MQTTPYFWECDCGSNYIHPKSVESCPRKDVAEHKRGGALVAGRALTGLSY